MPRLLVLLAAFALAACSGEPPVVEASTPVALYDADTDRRDLDRLSFVNGLHLTHPDPRFGGWSALEVSEDQSRLLAVSDSAYWLTAEIDWSGDDRIDRVHGFQIAPIRGLTGRRLDGEAADSETIAPLGDGRYAVSFEREHRINAYPLGRDWFGIESENPAPIAMPPGSEDWANNGGLEGLTTLSDGSLLAAVEYPPQSEADYLLWHRTPEAWQQVRVRAEPDYGMTALTTHEGWIYALERFWRRGEGNRIRIIRFAETRLSDGETVMPEFLGALEDDHASDNFEGIAVFDRNGRTTILILSDDNYSATQRTLLLAFELAD